MLGRCSNGVDRLSRKRSTTFRSRRPIASAAVATRRWRRQRRVGRSPGESAAGSEARGVNRGRRSLAAEACQGLRDWRRYCRITPRRRGHSTVTTTV